MTDYISLRIDADPCTSDITDLLAAFLADVGYESFTPDDHGLTAYIASSHYSPEDVEQTLDQFPMDTTLSAHTEKIIGQDWNAEWEKNYFQPITIGNRCLIHSSFHTGLPEAEIDITIDPKMAFGTGHHSTTALMVGYLLDMDLTGKCVIDMGTGTGILAIICSRLGAKSVTGIEIDEDAHANALENATLNKAALKLIHGDASSLSEFGTDADLFIANINRNIILADMEAYVSAMRPGATMLLSGFYTADIPKIEKAAAMHGLSLAESRSDHDWAALRLTKN